MYDEQGVEEPQIQMVPVQSSNVAAVGYDPERGIMRVQYNSGGMWDYEATPMQHQMVVMAESVGKALRSSGLTQGRKVE